MANQQATIWEPLASENTPAVMNETGTGYKSSYFSLFHLMESNDVDGIRNLLHQDPEQQNEIINAAFLDACREGKRKLAREFFGFVNANVRNTDDITALMLCSVHVDFSRRATMREVMNKLLEQGCDPNLVDASGRTALHWAAQHANEEAVRILIKAGVNVNTHDKSGHTPLLLAAGNLQGASAVHQLVHAGAEPMRCNLRGENALHIAVSMGLEKVAAKLLSFCLDLNATDVYGNTALHLACRRGDKEIVQMLLKAASPAKKINVNLRPLMPNEFTPLELACSNKHWDIAHMLLARPDCQMDVPYAQQNRTHTSMAAISSSGLTHQSTPLGALSGSTTTRAVEANLRRRLLPPMGRNTSLKRPKPQATSGRPPATATSGGDDPASSCSSAMPSPKDAPPPYDEVPLFEPPENALGFAVIHQNEEMVDALLKAKAVVEYGPGVRYRTHPLYLAVRENCPTLFTRLVEHYVSTTPSTGGNLTDDEKMVLVRRWLQTCHGHLLHLACDLGNFQVVKLLLNLGLDPAKPLLVPGRPCEVTPLSLFFLERGQSPSSGSNASNLDELWSLCLEEPSVSQALWHPAHLTKLFSPPLSHCVHRSSALQLLENWPRERITDNPELTEKVYLNLIKKVLVWLLKSPGTSGVDLRYLERLPPSLVKLALSAPEVLQSLLTPETCSATSPALWLVVMSTAVLRPPCLSLEASTQIVNRLWMSGQLEAVAVLCSLTGLRVSGLDELLEMSQTALLPPPAALEEGLLRQRLSIGPEKRSRDDTSKLLDVIKSSHFTPQPLYTLSIRAVRASLELPTLPLHPMKVPSPQLLSLRLPPNVERDLMWPSHGMQVIKRRSHTDGLLELLKQMHFLVQMT